MENNMDQALKHPINNNFNRDDEKTEVIRSHKVGTITLGASLIFFGALFITKTFTNLLTYEFILKLWPIIFILLGFEILISYITSKRDRFVYDKGAIFLMILLSMFAICMACAEFFVNYSQRYFS